MYKYSEKFISTKLNTLLLLDLKKVEWLIYFKPYINFNLTFFLLNLFLVNLVLG